MKRIRTFLIGSLVLSAFLLFTASLPLAHAEELLEPIGGATTEFFSYFNAVIKWTVGVCAGIAVAWVLWSGSMIITAGGNQGEVDSAKKHMFAAILGLLILLLIPTILHTINPVFFHVGGN